MNHAQRLFARLAAALLIASLVVGSRAPVARAAAVVVTDCRTDTPLRAALTTLQGQGGGTLTFRCGAGAHTIILTSGALPPITTAITIDGGDTIALSGNNATPILFVQSGAAVTLANLTITHGTHATDDGGAIIQEHNSTLTISGSRVVNSRSARAGGALVTYGSLTVRDSVFTGNEAMSGGAIYARHTAMVTITNSLLHDNVATAGAADTGLGGAILVWDGPQVRIQNSTLDNNHAADGGAIYGTANTTILLDQGSTISGNRANRYGAINSYGTLTLTGTHINANGAEFVGGLNIGGTATLTNVTLSDNQATASQGAMHIIGAATVTNATISGNRSTGVQNHGMTTLTNVTISGNTNQGLTNYGTAIVINVTVSENTGTGMDNYGTATLTNVTISGNTGGIYHSSTHSANTLTLKNTIITSSATRDNCRVPQGSATRIASSGHNLSSDSSCITYFTQFGDLNERDPHLAPLAMNGGPTATHRLQPESPAIDAGTSSGAPAIDQRGVARPQRAAVDIGAVEAQPREYRLAIPALIK